MLKCIKRDMKDSNCCPDNLQESSNEPEEGEIVDDMTYDIISSDEEETAKYLQMKKRIRELEAENEEIEQIAVISRSYDIDRAARIPTDVSSISSTEFKTPKKHKRHKTKEHKKKSCHHHHSHHRHHHSNTTTNTSTTQHNRKSTNRSRKTRCKRREKLLKKKHDKYAYKDFSSERLALESPDSLHSSLSSSSLSESDASPQRHISGEEKKDGDDYYHDHAIRDTLRLAVSRHRKNSARQTTHKNGLKEKLMRKDHAFTGNLFSVPYGVEDIKDVVIDEDDDDDDAVEICEPEADDIHSVDDSSDSLEEKELRLIALKSAVLKKHMERQRRNAESAYSPTDFDEMMMHEDKLADIDVVDLEEDDSQNACGTASPLASPQLMLDDSSQLVDCKPVDMDIANSDSEDTSTNAWNIKIPSDIPFPPFPPKDNPFAYGRLYMADFPQNTTNPPPPGVDDYEEMNQQPLMNFGKSQDIETQDMELENDDFEPIEPYPSCNTRNSEITIPELRVNSNTVSLHSNPNEEDLQEEEELALRALLLSKFQSPKNQKRTSVAETTENANETKSNSETSTRIVKPTEAILKEAVKRLQIHSQVECRKEEIPQDCGTPLQWEQQQLKEEGFHDIPLSWNHHNQMYTERNSFNAIPIPWDRQQAQQHSQPLSQETKSPTIALMSLQRKAKEFKTHSSGAREMERLPNNGYVSDTDHKTETGADREIKIDSVETMDEDNKRRLQKLKDEILSVTRIYDIQPKMESPAVHNNTRLSPTEVIVDGKTSEAESAIVNAENFKVKSEQDASDCNPEVLLEIPKTVKQPSEVSKVLPTPKASTNSQAGQEATSKDEKIALKENNVNSVNKKNLKTNSENNKPNQLNKKVTKAVTLDKSKDPKLSQIKTLTKTFNVSVPTPLPPTISNTPKTSVPPTPTYSVMRTTKIVKPNKVINRNVDTKRKVILIKSDQSAQPAKLMKVDPTASTVTVNVAKTATKTLDNTRLITSMEQVKHMCNVAQLVISVQNSCNESSEEEWADCDSMYRPLAEYNDIASPLSLNLESPCLTPARSNSPVESSLPLGKDKAFEDKGNNMLKEQRSSITFKTPEKSVSPKAPVVQQNSKKTASNLETPVAVRHLPAAAQDEYRKLIHRMKLLENQRGKKENGSSNEENTSKALTDEIKSDNDSAIAGIKASLVKQVLLRNTNNKPSSDSVATTDASSHPTLHKAHKANVLRSYESLYLKIGSGIVNNLDKSLRLVEEAKKAKVNKLRLENRLKELKAEMDMLQSKHKEEEQKISRIYPTICTTNEVITSLKQKRSKVYKAALSLGKALKGDDYRLNNDLKLSITSRTKLLATEIRLVNSLKAPNINNLEEAIRKTETENSASTEIIPANEEKVCLEKAETEENNGPTDESEGPLVSNDRSTTEQIGGGNTEFQDTASTAPAPPTICDTNGFKYETSCKALTGEEAKKDESIEDINKSLTSYISPLEHLRGKDDGTVDPNGVICPYDLMGNCEDATCKYVHIAQQDNKSKSNPP